MLFEIGSTIIIGSIGGVCYLNNKGPATSDVEKIKRIFASAKWVGENGETIRIQRKRKIKNGIEYIYQLPLGFDRNKIETNKHILEDGLNVRHKYWDFADLLKVKFDRTIILQIKNILTNEKISRKEIDINFDGMLRIKVFNHPIAKELNWNDAFLKNNGWAVPVGESRNDFIYHDFKKTPHVVVAGSTGLGKSQFLKMLITSLVMMKPDHAHFTLIDLKEGSAFNRFKDLKQVDEYGKNPKEAKKILEEIPDKMESLLDKIVNDGYEDADEAGIKDHHFIIIDEAADIAGDATCMDIVADIARRGRGANYHLIYCTQYPTNQTIPSQVRPNIGARICFRLKTNVQSRAVLDEGGAEELPEIPGRAIYQLNKNVIVQAPYMKNKEIKEKITPHIIIKSRKDDQDGQKSGKTTADREHTFKFEKA